jgi:hypothetical protein
MDSTKIYGHPGTIKITFAAVKSVVLDRSAPPIPYLGKGNSFISVNPVSKL